MDALTSVKELTFLERSLPFTFAPFRQIGTGFMGITDTETTTWAASIFRFPTDQFGGNIGDNGGYSAVGRLTHAIPLGPMEQGTAFHMGGSYSLIDPANDMIRYSTPPEIGIGETGGGVPVGVPSSVPPFVDTGNLDVNLINLFDVELAMTVGSWHMQSELVYAVVDQMAGGSVAFPGVYAQTGYILTGETRPYNWKNAVLGRVVPNRPLGEGGWGAWELAVRGSRIDLSDQNVDGGKLTDVTAGLNWYLNRYAKIQLNYIHAFLDRPTSVDSNADIAAMRAQLDF
ncbi:MAG: porin, partial [Pirellulales bacterium]